MIMILPLILLSTVFFIILSPVSAWAWGPATHLEIAHGILSNPALLTGAVRELILRFPHDFIYGSVSADIVMGKNLVDELRHCHNWKVGLQIFRGADSESQRAFASGYLGHLAADTVAHNHFIPEMMIRSYPTKTLRHLYWELRFDSLAGEEALELHRVIAQGAHGENHRLLDAHIKGTPLSFGTNKAIFSSFMLLNRVKRWQKMLRLIDKSSRWPLPTGAREKFLKSSIAAVADVLNNNERARCMQKDPTGKDSLRAAKVTRKRLKVSSRQGRQWHCPAQGTIKTKGSRV